MMNKFMKFIGLSLILALTGCFEISETISINKDGSGEYVYKIDAAKMLSTMISMAGLDTTKSPETTKISFDSSMIAGLQKFKNAKGLSNFKLDTSEEGVYVISVKFENLSDLNSALDADKSSESDKNVYSYKKGKFTVGNAFNSAILSTGISEDDESEMAKSMYKEMKYSLTVNLPGKVKKSNNKSAEIASDKRTVVFNATFDELMSKEKTTQNVIVFK